MSSVKAVLYHYQTNLEGKSPVYLRITKNRKSRYIAIGLDIDPKTWDYGTNLVSAKTPNSIYINNFITQKLAEASAIDLQMQAEDKYVPTQKVKDHIMGRTSISFTKFSERILDEIKYTGTVGTYKRYKTILEKLKYYLGERELRFEEITVHWLKNYEIYLRVKLENKTNTIHNNLKTIRCIIKAAINEEILPYERNPFLRYKLKTETVRKSYLTEAELLSLEEMQLELGSKKELHRNMYVFAAYAGGLRISDILQLRWKNFDGERLIIQTQKTKSTLSIKLPAKAIEILIHYKPTELNVNHFIFPALSNTIDYSDKGFMHQAISSATAYTNKDLKSIAKTLEINKKIHFHTSRHTFAVRSLSKGMRIEHLSKLMTHTSIKTTQIYAQIVNEDLDKAMSIFN